jgi:restriction endonuclease S subunit
MASLLKQHKLMHKPLSTIAEIRSGQTFRGSIKDSPTGNVRVLQIRDIKACTEIAPGTLPRIRWISSHQTGRLKDGDIVMPARGEYYSAAMYKTVTDGKDGSSETPVVATNQLFILNSRTAEVTNEYLCWYLNQQAPQQYFKTYCNRTSIAMLNIQSLGALPVPLPALEIQHKIVALHQCWQREQQLTQQLLNNREQMLKGVYQQLLEP